MPSGFPSENTLVLSGENIFDTLVVSMLSPSPFRRSLVGLILWIKLWHGGISQVLYPRVSLGYSSLFPHTVFSFGTTM